MKTDNELIADRTERINNNELIHVFMGNAYCSCGQSSKHFQTGINAGDLKYNTSWDWLMPVVEKIESLMWEVEIRATRCTIEQYPDSSKYFYGANGDKIKSTYHAVVEFIKWYNSNPK